MNHPLSEKAWTIWKGQVPTHSNCQTMLTDESVMLKYNISIIESHWLIIVCISSGSYSQLMLMHMLHSEILSPPNFNAI